MHPVPLKWDRLPRGNSRERHECGINFTTVGRSTPGLEWAVLGPFFFAKERSGHKLADMMAEISSTLLWYFDWPGIGFSRIQGLAKMLCLATWFDGRLIGWRSGAGARFISQLFPPHRSRKFKIGKTFNIKTKCTILVDSPLLWILSRVSKPPFPSF